MNRRVLVVDDTRSIHDDFKKILCPGDTGGSETLANARAAFLGADASEEPPSDAGGEIEYEMESAFQGEEALELVRERHAAGTPYSVAFVDIRMPPGWDGVQTIKELWKVDPDLHCVICTAYSDYSWDETVAELGQTDRLLILKKPFDPAEIRQTASAFTAKWSAAASERAAMTALRQKEAEARSYAMSLETLNKALATSKASADRMSTMKSDFMLRLTSEVSTHLNRILDRLIEDGRTEGLDEALDRSQRLLETIDKVVDFTNVEAGTLVLDSAPCCISDLLCDLETSYRARAEHKGVEFAIRLSNGVPARVKTDPARLEQILGHLVDNALRFTEEGTVTIAVTTEPADSWDRTRLRIDVTDTGCGITPEEIGHIFEPFSTRESADLSCGSGLGLTVAKQIARLLGGDLHFDSSPGAGSTFTLALEVGRAEEEEASAARGTRR